VNVSTKRNRLLPGLAVIVVAVGVFAFYGLRHEVPEGQKPLAMLDTSGIERLRSEFNAASDHARVIVLLSPT